MKRRSHAKRRDLNEPLIVEALESIGARVERLDDPCDLLVGYRGVNYLIEVKNTETSGKQTEKQIKFENSWNGQHDIAETVEEAIAIVMGEL